MAVPSLRKRKEKIRKKKEEGKTEINRKTEVLEWNDEFLRVYKNTKRSRKKKEKKLEKRILARKTCAKKKKN